MNFELNGRATNNNDNERGHVKLNLNWTSDSNLSFNHNSFY